MKTTIIFILLIFIKLNGIKGQDIAAENCVEDQLCLADWEENSTADDENQLSAISLAVDTPKITAEDSAKLSLNDTNYIPPERFKTRLPQALIIPGALILVGLTTIGDHGIYSSHQARRDLLKATGGHGGPVDDILIFSPYAEFGALLLLNVKCRNDLVNTTLLILKSELLMLALTYSLKYAIKYERPYSYQAGLDGVPLAERERDSEAFLSFPSGHTSEAFVAATIVYREYRYLSPWYGIGSYALATTVGLYRMINDRHWMSDVLVGAGIGILSANIVYATHQHRWGRNEICVIPRIGGGFNGVTLTYNFK